MNPSGHLLEKEKAKISFKEGLLKCNTISMSYGSYCAAQDGREDDGQNGELHKASGFP